jgi:hypothetical protein
VTGHPEETPDGLIAAADVDMYLRKPSAHGARDRRTQDRSR